MRNLIRASAVAIALLSSSSAMATVVAPSNYTFDFTGTCTDCRGTANAVLQVKNYVLGGSLSTSNFVSFTYEGTNLLRAYTINQIMTLTGSIGSTPGSYAVSLTGFSSAADSTYNFSTGQNGNWSTGPFNRNADQGTAGRFSVATAAVPEPATWALMLLGFGIVGFGMRRRQNVHTAVAYA